MTNAEAIQMIQDGTLHKGVHVRMVKDKDLRPAVLRDSVQVVFRAEVIDGIPEIDLARVWTNCGRGSGRHTTKLRMLKWVDPLLIVGLTDEATLQGGEDAYL